VPVGVWHGEDMARAEQVTVRPAQPEDAEGLASLFASLGYSTSVPVVVAQFSLYHPGSAFHALTAEHHPAEGPPRLVGAATVSIQQRLYAARPVAQLTALVTDAEARQLGVGRALVKAATEIARTARCERLFVRSDRRRTESHDFYRMLGFDEVNLTFDLPLDP
jgi:GNAT superfamily N-acetyltransferase